MTTICRHIRTNGERCGSPALRNHLYCYFHRTLARRHTRQDEVTETVIHSLNPAREAVQTAVPSSPALDLPALEDRESIQVALSVIIGSLARNELDGKRASALLYGLQVASANAAGLDHHPRRSHLVIETTPGPSGEDLAADEEPQFELDFQQFLADQPEDDEEEDEEEEDDSSTSGSGPYRFG